MAGLLIFQTRKRDSFLCACHGGVKLLSLIVLSILLSSSSSYTFIFIATALIFFAVVVERTPIILWLRQGFFFLIIASFIFVSEYAEYKSLVLALAAFFKFVSLLSASLLLLDTTSPSDIARGTGWLLSFIAGPFAWRVASLIELTLSMLPTLSKVVSETLEAQRSRGARFLRHPIKTLSGYSISLISRLLNSTIELADALESRAYDNTKARYVAPPTRRDLILILILALLTGGRFWIK